MKLQAKRVSERFWFVLCGLAMVVIGLVLGILVGFVALRGSRVISLEFLFSFPRKGMSEGGIFPAIVGTLYLVLGSTLVSLPLGVFTAVYLVEYAPRSSPFLRLIRQAIHCLAGIPSIVFGLFGLAVFVKLFGFGVSIVSGSLTLGIMSLPVVIASCEEALRSVPYSFREASLALGAPRWTTVRRVVLPAAFPGILTGLILAVGRVAGETAPIMFTAATFYARGLPRSPFDRVLALPYHIYGLVTEGAHPEKQIPMAYGTALVLLALVLLVNLSAILLRRRLRLVRKW